ncbi:Rv1355c family protein [Brevibacillus sp. FSL L8-0710]|uniref:Rv1355c family protein n=1 Tax=Brevibacillus sp. FSL L8-0710 TaxID=2975313 RepID=UPI0030F71B2E
MHSFHDWHPGTKQEETGFVWRPEFFRLSRIEDQHRVSELMETERPEVIDRLRPQLQEMIKAKHAGIRFSPEELSAAVDEYLGSTPISFHGVWVYYPWRKKLVHLLDEEDFIFVRTNRNRNKITAEEQKRLSEKSIGVIGLSVGQSIALTLAMERSCGEIRIADFDTLELSNLNRIRAGVFQLGLPKWVITAREIAEIDPYLRVVCYPEGITEENIERFLWDGGKLDILVDECDSLNIKILAREKARLHGIPVVMDTSDRGLLDVERFDLEPDRPILHGLAEGLDYSRLQGLSDQEKIPAVLKIVGYETMSERLKASLQEVGKSIMTWPQLASSVSLGAAVGADVCRRISLGQFTGSGRYFVDMEEIVSDRQENLV